jgi:hypothetical protein
VIFNPRLSCIISQLKTCPAVSIKESFSIKRNSTCTRVSCPTFSEAVLCCYGLAAYFCFHHQEPSFICFLLLRMNDKECFAWRVARILNPNFELSTRLELVQFELVFFFPCEIISQFSFEMDMLLKT